MAKAGFEEGSKDIVVGKRVFGLTVPFLKYGTIYEMMKLSSSKVFFVIFTNTIRELINLINSAASEN